MLEVTSLEDSKRRFVPENCDSCLNNGKGADKCKLNKDGSCNYEPTVQPPICHLCVYGMAEYALNNTYYKCSIGKFFGNCDSFVDNRPSVPVSLVNIQKKNETIVDILGSKWTIRFTTEKDEPRLNGCDGFTDWTEKLIGIENGINGNIGNKQKYTEKLIRHEVIHAFLFESGLGDSMEHREYGHDETTIDWFAYQIDKINDVVMEVMKSMTL